MTAGRCSSMNLCEKGVDTIIRTCTRCCCMYCMHRQQLVFVDVEDFALDGVLYCENSGKFVIDEETLHKCESFVADDAIL